MAGMFNTSAPGRGWYLASLVIVISLAAHSAARPFLDPWVDMTEFVSLLSTLLIFMGGMAWTVDDTGLLGVFVEKLSMALILGTALMAGVVEVRVWVKRNADYGTDGTDQPEALSIRELTERAAGAFTEVTKRSFSAIYIYK